MKTTPIEALTLMGFRMMEAGTKKRGKKMKDFNEMQCYKAHDQHFTFEPEYCDSSWDAINQLIFEHLKENDFKLSAGPHMLTGYDLPIKKAKDYYGQYGYVESLVKQKFFNISQNQIDQITNAYLEFKRAMEELDSGLVFRDDQKEGKNQ